VDAGISGQFPLVHIQIPESAGDRIEILKTDAEDHEEEEENQLLFYGKIGPEVPPDFHERIITQIHRRMKGFPDDRRSREIYILFIARIINRMGDFVTIILTLFLTTRIGLEKKETGFFLTLVAFCRIPGGGDRRKGGGSAGEIRAPPCSALC